MDTQEIRLCDDNGMVSTERVEPGSPGTESDKDLTYLKLAINLRKYTGLSPVEEFHCTGSMHAAGMLFLCTSPIHKMPPAQNPIILSPIQSITLS
jgi:hypothetical protein